MPSTSTSRLEALQARHSAISNRIEMEQSRPGTSDEFLKMLKRQRLHLKEEIESVS